MEPLTIGFLMIAVLVGLIVSGIHIGLALISLGFLGIWLTVGDFNMAGSILGTGPFYFTHEYVMTTIAMFTLMGIFVNASGAGAELFDMFHLWLRRVRGGMGIAIVGANAVFAAVTGVSMASAAAFSKIALPHMVRLGYDKRFSVGTIASSSILGMLIPPSVLLIVYGLLSAESIGRLFIAGVVPGIILALIFILEIMVIGRLRPNMVGGLVSAEKISWGQRFRALSRTWSVILLIVLVLGGIYGGLFTPVEAGAIGSFGGFLLLILRRKMTFATLRNVLAETALVTVSFFFLFIGAQTFGRMLALTGVIVAMSEFAVSLALPPLAIIGVLLLIIIVMGFFLDSVSIMIIALPVMIPVVEALGFNLIWFGIVSLVAVEIGLVTPPFGMVVFTVKAALGDEPGLQDIEVQDIFRGVVPFLPALGVALVLFMLFPTLSTWLPSTIM